VLELDTREVAEHDGGEMPAGAGPERGVIQFAGMRLGVVDQLLDRVKRRVRRHHQHVLRGRDQHEGSKSLTGSNSLLGCSVTLTASVCAPKCMVWPSGQAFAGGAAPILPPAPGRFSMTTFCPHASVSFCARMRPSVSMVPPPGNAMSMRTGRSG